MTRDQHLIEAERLLVKADLPDNHPEASKHYVRLAHVHALLAAVPQNVYFDVVEQQLNRLGSLPEKT